MGKEPIATGVFDSIEFKLKTMRSFQKLLHELKEVVEKQKPGDELTPPPAMPSMQINGHRLAYVDFGTEQPGVAPVILLHGFGGFFMDWPRVIAPLAKVTRVIALDLPGWGFSEPHPNANSLEDEVRVLGAFITRLGLQNVTLCGLSYGAGVAWASAAMHLPRVSRLLLLNPMPPHPLRFLHSPIYRAIFFLNARRRIGLIGIKLMTKSHYKLICRENLFNKRLLDTFYLDLAFRVIKQPKMPLILFKHATGAKLVDWNAWEHRLAGIRIPVHILQGENDRIFSVKSATELCAMIPGATLTTVPRCGHAMVFDQHKRLSEFIIRDLLGKDTRDLFTAPRRASLDK